MMKPVPVILASDFRGIKGLAVAVKSAIGNRDCPLEFYILEREIPDSEKQLLEANWRENYPELSIHWLPVAPNKYSGLRKWRGGDMIYARLDIDKIPGLERCIYIDIDVVVNSGLKELFETDLEGTVIGAVEEGGGKMNSGVLLIDVVRWRQENLSEKILANCYENGWPDQWGFNAVITHWKRIPPAWNCPNTEKPEKILHYKTKIKPWQTTEPKMWLFYEWLDQTPYTGWRPEPNQEYIKESFFSRLYWWLWRRYHNLFPNIKSKP
jgi:lipopolysaccharide biosynthesis glycosyltransferase